MHTKRIRIRLLIATTALLALVLAAPATAQAPSLEYRVGAAEFDIQVLQARIGTLEEDLRDAKEQVGDATAIMSCLDVLPMAVSKRPNGDLYLTPEKPRPHVWVALVKRRCVAPRKGDFQWRGTLR